MFETLEAIRKYPLEAKRRLVAIVTGVIVIPVAILWVIWFVMTLELKPLVLETEEPRVPESNILAPYGD